MEGIKTLTNGDTVEGERSKRVTVLGVEYTRIYLYQIRYNQVILCLGSELGLNRIVW